MRSLEDLRVDSLIEVLTRRPTPQSVQHFQIAHHSLLGSEGISLSNELGGLCVPE